MQITAELIAGCLTVLGGAVIILNRLGLIQFGKEKKMVNAKCPAHAPLSETVVKVLQQQVANVKTLDHIGKELDYFNRAIAVLLDRSGGIPKGLER